MARKDIGVGLNRDNRNAINHNFIELYKGQSDYSAKLNQVEQNMSDKMDNFIEDTSNVAVDKVIGDVNTVVNNVIDNAKLNWLNPVDSYGELPTDANKGDTVMTRDNGYVYRFDGEQWIEIQEIDAGPVNELDSRLSQQLADVVDQSYKIYGVVWDKSSSPTLTRTNDAQGMVANVGVDNEWVQNDFDDAQIYREIAEVTDELGNVFIQIPKFYIKKTDGKGFMSIQITKAKLPGYYLPWCFWDFEKEKELDYYYHSKYKGSLSEDGKLESKPDKHPLASRNIVQLRDYAKANNDTENGVKGYQQFDIHAHDVLSTLFMVEFATLHSQGVMSGFTSGRYHEADVVTVAEENANRVIIPKSSADLFVVGQSIGVGTSRGGQQIANARLVLDIGDYDDENGYIEFDGEPIDTQVGHYVYSNGWINGFSRDILASSGSVGDNTSGKFPCMYRGIESPWGDIYQFVDGININNHQAWVSKNAEEYASNLFTHPYEKLSYENIDSNVWVSEMGFDPKYPFAQFPIKGGGGSSTYYADHYYQETGARIALVGGSWNGGSSAGLFLWYLNYSSSDSYLIFGGRLLKKAL